MSERSQPRLVDSCLGRRRLLYVLSEGLEKLSRLQQILKNQQVFITAEHADAEPTSAVDTLIGYLDKHCQTFLDCADPITLLLHGGQLNEAQETGIVTALEILISSILQVHEMLLLLPREAAKPQASFLLRNCFGMEDLGASIVLTNYISAYEYRFEDILKQVNVEQEELEALTQGGNVLCQAFADKDNPLAWAVLAHEYGHAMDDRNGITKKILAEGRTHPELKQGENRNAELKVALDFAIVAETVADFIAAHVLGPASLMPILFVEMMQPRLKKIERISAGHPPTPLRVRLVREYLKTLGVSTSDFEVVFETYEFDYRGKLEEMEKTDREAVEAMGADAEKLLSPLTNSIFSQISSLGLRRFEEGNAECARDLQYTLPKQPISSTRKRSDEDMIAGLDSLKPGESTPEQVREVFSGLDEVPIAASEILTAGWLYKLSSIEDELKKTFPKDGEQKADLSGYAQYRDRTDGLLVKSLELADVHAEVLRRFIAV